MKTVNILRKRILVIVALQIVITGCQNALPSNAYKKQDFYLEVLPRPAVASKNKIHIAKIVDLRHTLPSYRQSRSEINSTLAKNLVTDALHLKRYIVEEEVTKGSIPIVITINKLWIYYKPPSIKRRYSLFTQSYYQNAWDKVSPGKTIFEVELLIEAEKPIFIKRGGKHGVYYYNSTSEALIKNKIYLKESESALAFQKRGIVSFQSLLNKGIKDGLQTITDWYNLKEFTTLLGEFNKKVSGKNFWDKGHWIDMIEGREENRTHQFRLRYEPIPRLMLSTNWTYVFNQPTRKYYTTWLNMGSKGMYQHNIFDNSIAQAFSSSSQPVSKRWQDNYYHQAVFREKGAKEKSIHIIENTGINAPLKGYNPLWESVSVKYHKKEARSLQIGKPVKITLASLAVKAQQNDIRAQEAQTLIDSINKWGQNEKAELMKLKEYAPALAYPRMVTLCKTFQGLPLINGITDDVQTMKKNSFLVHLISMRRDISQYKKDKKLYAPQLSFAIKYLTKFIYEFPTSEVLKGEAKDMIRELEKLKKSHNKKVN